MPFLGSNGLAGGPTSGPRYAPPEARRAAPPRPSGGFLSALPAAIAHALSSAAPALRHVAATHSSASAGHTATHATSGHASARASGRLAAAIAAGIQRDPNNPFEVMREAGLMGGDPFGFPSPAYPSSEIWNFSRPEYSPQGGMADPLPSLTGHLYDVLPAKTGTVAKGAGKRFGDLWVRPIPLVNTNRPLAERQRIWGFGAHGLPGRQPPPGLAAGRRRLSFRD